MAVPRGRQRVRSLPASHQGTTIAGNSAKHNAWPNANQLMNKHAFTSMTSRWMVCGAFAMGLALGVLAGLRQNQPDEGKTYHAPEASML